jgi:hypothetical protein
VSPITRVGDAHQNAVTCFFPHEIVGTGTHGLDKNDSDIAMLKNLDISLSELITIHSYRPPSPNAELPEQMEKRN